MTTFELGTRVPLVVRAPYLRGAQRGARRAALVEAVSLFPTLVALAGLPPVPAREGLQGESLVPLMLADAPTPAPTGPNGAHDVPNATKTDARYAFSQFAKKYVWDAALHAREAWNTCGGVNRSAFDVMGFSVRADDWRYTEWLPWDKAAQRADWAHAAAAGGAPLARELYAQPRSCAAGDFDCQSPAANEWNASAAHLAVADKLAAVVRAHFQHDYDYMMYR